MLPSEASGRYFLKTIQSNSADSTWCGRGLNFQDIGSLYLHEFFAGMHIHLIIFFPEKSVYADWRCIKDSDKFPHLHLA